MRTFAATVLVAAACFLVFADAQLSVEPVNRAATNLTAHIDFCNIATCKNPSLHVLCLYPSQNWGNACQPAYPTISSVTNADIVAILKVHNDYRRNVAKGLETQGNPGPQPSASNMRELKWDQEIADMAQAYARQCINGHDGCHDSPRFQVGQNMGIEASGTDSLGTPNWNKTVADWYKEVKDMKSTYVTSYPKISTKTIGHYTQVVWGDTYLVGCASVYFKSTAFYGPTFPYVRLYICNYGPSGNFLGAAVYKQGKAGSACPKGTKNNNGLCA